MATRVQQELIFVTRVLKWLKVQVGLQDWLHIATKDQFVAFYSSVWNLDVLTTVSNLEKKLYSQQDRTTDLKAAEEQKINLRV